MTSQICQKTFAVLEGKGEGWTMRYMKHAMAYMKHQFELT